MMLLGVHRPPMATVQFPDPGLAGFDLQGDQPACRLIIVRDLDNGVDSPVRLVLLPELPPELAHDQQRNPVDSGSADSVRCCPHCTDHTSKSDAAETPDPSSLLGDVQIAAGRTITSVAGGCRTARYWK